MKLYNLSQWSTKPLLGSDTSNRAKSKVHIVWSHLHHARVASTLPMNVDACHESHQMHVSTKSHPLIYRGDEVEMDVVPALVGSVHRLSVKALRWRGMWMPSCWVRAHFTESPPSPTSLLDLWMNATSPSSPNLVSGFSLHPFESQYAFGDSNKTFPKFFVFHETSQTTNKSTSSEIWQILWSLWPFFLGPWWFPWPFKWFLVVGWVWEKVTSNIRGGKVWITASVTFWL